MVIMAGMLLGVECAGRRRLWQGSAGAETGDGTRRPSFCIYAAGHGGHPAGAGNPTEVVLSACMLGFHSVDFWSRVLHVWMIRRSWVFVCMQQQSGVMETIHGWTLDSNVRAAKERLDQKLRRKREAVIKSTAHTHGNRLLKKERIDIAAGTTAPGASSDEGTIVDVVLVGGGAA
jgi:hypothetical protein